MKGFCVFLCLSYTIIPWMIISAFDNDRELATGLSTDFDEAEQFPETIELKFDHNDNQVHLNLAKDEEATRILSPQVVENSYFLPDDLFDYDTQHEFTAYRAGESNIVLVHRPSQYHAPKFYGRYTDGTDRYVIHSHEDDHAILYIKSDVHRVRKRRQVTDTAYVEVFLIADYSLFDHVKTDVLGGSTNNQAKKYLKEYMSLVIKDVDTIFSNVSTTYPIRAHFMQYQVVVSTDRQPWMAATTPVTATELSALKTYYLDTLVALYAFPTPDILIQLTRYSLDGGVVFLSSGDMCGTSSDFPAAIVTQNFVQQIVAQMIASRMSVGLDDGTGGCENSDRHIMSSTFGPVSDVALRGNRWTFSSCSKSDIETKLSSNSFPCVYTEDSLFAFDDSTERLGDVYTNAEQCVFVYGSTADDSCPDLVNCYTDQCNVNSVCQDITFGQNSSCAVQPNNNNVEFKCQSGFCTVFGDTTTSSTSSTSTTSSTPSTTSSTSSTTSSTSSTTSSTSSTTSSTSSTTSSTSSTTSSTSSTTSSTSSTTSSTSSTTSSTSSTTSSTSSTTSSTSSTTSSTSSTTSSTSSTTSSTSSTTSSTSSTTSSTSSTTSSTPSTTSSTSSTTSSTSSTTSSTPSTTSSTPSTTSSTTSTASSTSSTTSSTPSTTSTTLSTSAASTATTTEDGQKQTTTTTEASLSTTTADKDCIIETGYVEFDLPGCGCCGGCGCDAECTDCDPGLPSFNKTEDCTPAPDCCGSKVRVRTLFVPEGCPHNYVQGPRTIIQKKEGWEETDTGASAEVYQDNNGRWQVQLVPDN